MTPDSSRSPLASGVRSLLIGAGALCAIVAVSVAAASLFRIRPFPAATHSAERVAGSRAGLGLRAEVRPGSLQVSWDHEAKSVRNATSGSLTFQDGDTRKTLQLSQTTARAGKVFYAARSTQVQVALTIFAPDHVVSESISARVPFADKQSALSAAGDAEADVAVPSRDGEIAIASPEAERPSGAGQSSASAQHPVLRQTDRASRPASPNPGNSIPPASRPEESATSSAEVEAPDSTAHVPPAGATSGDHTPATVAIRVQVDETGNVVNAVLVPQEDLDPAFAEAALAMAR